MPKEPKHPPNRRGSVRVLVRLDACARRLGAESTVRRRIYLPYRGIDMSWEGAKRAEGMRDALREMSDRLDALLKITQQREIEGDFALTVEIREISGSGLRFGADVGFRGGELLEIALTLGAFPTRMVWPLDRLTGTMASTDDQAR